MAVKTAKPAKAKVKAKATKAANESHQDKPSSSSPPS